MRALTRAEWVVVVCACCALPALADSPRENEIRTFLAEMEYAHARHNIAAFGNRCVEESVFILASDDAAGDATVVGKQESLRMLERFWTNRRLVSRDIRLLTCAVQGDVAYVTLESSDHYGDGDEASKRSFAVLVCQGGAWRLAVGMPLFFRLAPHVKQVLPGTPAAEAGIQPGDVVQSLDGQDVYLAGELTAAMEPGSSQAPRELTVLRNGQELRCSIPTGAAGIAFEDRLLPDGGADFLGPEQSHPIQDHLQQELAHLKDLVSAPAPVVTSPFLRIMPLPDRPAEIFTERTIASAYRQIMEHSARFVDTESMRLVDPGIIVQGPVALAAARTEAVVKSNGQLISSPTSLHVFARLDGQWRLAAVLPARVLMAPGDKARQPSQPAVDEPSNRFSGIGVHVGLAKHGLLVEGVLPGGPAEQAGFRQGDVIVAADGKRLAGMEVEQAVKHILGPEGTEVRLLVGRGQVPPRTVTLTRQSIAFNGVSHRMLPRQLGLLEIRGFNQDTVEATRQAIEELTKSGAKGLVLDLTRGGRGPLNNMIGVAELFLAPGQVLFRIVRDGENARDVSCREPQMTTLPAVIMIGEETGPASELLAGAMKCTGRATLVGQRTAGQAAVMTPVKDHPTQPQDYRKTGDFLIPGSGAVFGKGVSPDVPVDKTSRAELLKRAVLLLTELLNT